MPNDNQNFKMENVFWCHQLEIKVKYLEDRCSKAEQKNEELTLELSTVNKQNLALRKNISSVIKTARMELERKDREIKDLQQK